MLAAAMTTVMAQPSVTTDTRYAISNFHDPADQSCSMLQVSDYYNVINNCNFYLHNADTAAVKSNIKFMVPEYAQVKAVRAWAYHQLVKNYKEVPYITEPVSNLGVIDRFDYANNLINKDNLVDKLIADGILQYLDTPYPQYGSASDTYGKWKTDYPFFLDKANYSENLLKNMNMMIEVDILLVKQIELKYLAKIKQLFYMLTTSGSSVPNVSQLAQELGMSRATVMHYIKYLEEARLVNMIYGKGDEFPKKPARVLLHNSNLMYSFYPRCFDEHDVLETFFCNTLWKDHKVNKHGNLCSFLVDEQLEFKIAEHSTKLKSKAKSLYAVNQCDIGEGNQIPLWIFGFLY